MDPHAVNALSEILAHSRNLCVFTGAGISCPSGIPDFRSVDGLYNRKTGNQIPPETIVSHSFFERHPQEFYEFYIKHMLYPDAEPNDAHRFFAGLETPEREVTVVTQNIDGLHTAAGSTRVFELHGSVHRNRCTRCGAFFDLRGLLSARGTDGIPRCPQDGARIKPKVVLYEEPLDDAVADGAVRAISSADTLILVGSSLVVYPAASFIRYFRGNHLILINKSKTAYDGMAEYAFYEDIIDVVHAVERLG